MEQKECDVCKRFVEEKYKSVKIWKALAILFAIIATVLLILYLSSGSIVVDNTIEYQNEVDIENGSGNNTNTNNGNIVVHNDDNSYNVYEIWIAVAIILIIILFIGGVLIAHAIHNKKSFDRSQSRSNCK